MEQRLARQAHNLDVVGSIPAGAIRCPPSPEYRGFCFPPRPRSSAWLGDAVRALPAKRVRLTISEVVSLEHKSKPLIRQRLGSLSSLNLQ